MSQLLKNELIFLWCDDNHSDQFLKNGPQNKFFTELEVDTLVHNCSDIHHCTLMQENVQEQRHRLEMYVNQMEDNNPFSLHLLEISYDDEVKSVHFSLSLFKIERLAVQF